MLHIRQFRWGPAIVAAALVVAVAGCSGTPSSNDSAPLPYNPNPQPSPRENNEGIGREIDATEQPESTFGIDIDTASYNFARRQLLDGHRPSPDMVRPEEFVNAEPPRVRRAQAAPGRTADPGRGLGRPPGRGAHLRHRRVGLHGGVGSARSGPGRADRTH